MDPLRLDCPACGATMLSVALPDDEQVAIRIINAWVADSSTTDRHVHECADPACQAIAHFEPGDGEVMAFPKGGPLVLPLRRRDRTTPIIDEVLVGKGGELMVRGRHLAGAEIVVRPLTNEGRGDPLKLSLDALTPRAEAVAMTRDTDLMAVAMADLDHLPVVEPLAPGRYIVEARNANGLRPGGQASVVVEMDPDNGHTAVFAPLAHAEPGLACFIDDKGGRLSKDEGLAARDENAAAKLDGGEAAPADVAAPA